MVVASLVLFADGLLLCPLAEADYLPLILAIAKTIYSYQKCCTPCLVPKYPNINYVFAVTISNNA